ncbi:hypothetical protein D3C87_482670 [compost metagenome]
MTEKVNGTSFAGQFLTGGLNFYKVRTTLDIRATGVVGDASQKRLDKLVETISTRAQPVIMSAVTTTTETAPADLPGAGAGAVTVYTLSFAIEHNMAWEVAGSKNPDLAESLDGVEGFVYDIATTNDNNVSAALVESL